MQLENTKHLSPLLYPPHSLFYELVSSENYQSPINQLTSKNLEKLSAFSTTIEEPLILGEFNNEKHYLKTLKLVLESTHETRNRILFFLNKIIPSLSTTKSLLDIGPGDCLLTKSLAPNFQHITAVDINHHILNNLSQHLPSSIELKTIPDSIINAQFGPEYYDLAVLSHSLYYIDAIHWVDVIKKILQSVKKNGFLVIVLGGDEGDKANLIESFGGQTIMIDQLASRCKNIFGHSNVSLYASDEAFVAISLHAMVHIAAFMLCDANITTSKNSLIEYINHNLKHHNNLFKMTTKQKYIVIRKATHLTVETDYEHEAIFS